MEVVASLCQGRRAAAQCGLFTHKSVPVIFEPPCTYVRDNVCTQFSHGLTWDRNQAVRLQDDEKKKLLLQIKFLL